MTTATALAPLAPPVRGRGQPLTDKVRIRVRHLRIKRAVRIVEEIDREIKEYCRAQAIRYSLFMERAAVYLLHNGETLTLVPATIYTRRKPGAEPPTDAERAESPAARITHGISLDPSTDAEIVAYCRARNTTYNAFLDYAARQYLTSLREEIPARAGRR